MLVRPHRETAQGAEQGGGRRDDPVEEEGNGAHDVIGRDSVARGGAGRGAVRRRARLSPPSSGPGATAIPSWPSIMSASKTFLSFFLFLFFKKRSCVGMIWGSISRGGAGLGERGGVGVIFIQSHPSRRRRVEEGGVAVPYHVVLSRFGHSPYAPPYRLTRPTGRPSPANRPAPPRRVQPGTAGPRSARSGATWIGGWPCGPCGLQPW